MKVRANILQFGTVTCSAGERIIDVPNGVSMRDAILAAGCNPDKITIAAMDQADCRIVHGEAQSMSFEMLRALKVVP